MNNEIFRRFATLIIGAWAVLAPLTSHAEPCETEDFQTAVTGKEQCLLLRSYGDTAPKALLIWLHGDVSSGGPATYHFPLAEAAAKEFASEATLSVALVRPGYPDGSGKSSSVAEGHTGRSDHYTQTNVTEVATVIERLIQHYSPKKVVVIGHSGGAATTAIMLGLRPALIPAAVLVACPCDLVSWRSGRRAWSASENPAKWIPQIDTKTKVIALTGERDDNTRPKLAEDYVSALSARGIAAEFRALPYETHNSAFKSPEVSHAIRRLLESNL